MLSAPALAALARQKLVTGGRGHSAADTGRFSDTGAADGLALLLRSRQRFASVGRSSRRGTTMSTMPCCLRYSARWKPSGTPAIGVVAAVEPQLAAGRSQRREPPVCEPLHARRPVGLGDPALERRGRERERADSTQGGDGDAGVLELVAAVELRRRQVEQAVVVLVDQAPALLGRR